MKKILFICSQNKLRSPTAEAVFCNKPGIDARSAGLNHDAEVPVSKEDIDWADIIFVMETVHKGKLRKRFKASLKQQRLICLDIPDNYEYMQPELIAIFKNRIPQFLY